MDANLSIHLTGVITGSYSISPDEDGDIIKTICIGVVTVLTIISNTVNLTIIPRLRRLSKVDRFFLSNLSVADLLVGIITCIPSFFSALNYNKWIFGDIYCQVSGVFHSTSVSVSIWSLAVISTLRYLAVLHPTTYRKFTGNRYAIVAEIIWFSALFMFLLPIMLKGGMYYQYDKRSSICGLYWDYRWFCVLTGVQIPIGAGSLLAFTTLRTLRALSKRSELEIGTGSRSEKSIQRQRRAIKLLVVTAAMFFTLWGPYVFLVVPMALDPSIWAPDWVHFLFTWMANANSFVNVLVYSCMYDQFRNRLLYNLKWIASCGKIPTSQSTELSLIRGSRALTDG